MKMLSFAGRNAKEILRDPLTLFFGLGFPIVLLLLLTAIQANIPVSIFEISHLAPGISVFALSFMTLFSATIIAKDRGSSLLQRLYTTPLTARDFILGYTLPILPIAAVQSVICYLTAVLLGLKIDTGLLYALLLHIPTALLYIAMGLLFGSVLSDKQVGGICGALVTNVTAWLSGAWFDLELAGGAFKRIAKLLPFAHAVETERAALAGASGEILPHLLWVLGYTAVIMTAAVLLFLRQMKKQ